MLELWYPVEGETLTRYVCTSCGHEVLTQDRAPAKYCASCGARAEPAQWPASRQRERLVQVIGDQLGKIDPVSFAADARANRDPLPDMDQRVQGAKGLIGMWMGRDGVEYLQSVDQEEMDAVLDGILEAAPAQGFVFWQFRDWYYRFASRARDVLIANLA